MGHALYTPTNCPYDHKILDGCCPVCDGGLSICKICGAAEVTLDQACVGHVRDLVIKGKVTSHYGIWCDDQLQTHYPDLGFTILRDLVGENVEIRVSVKKIR